MITAFSILVEVDCGVPPPIPHSVMLWDNVSTVGSQVVYQCKSGYRNVGEGNASVCTASGEWDVASLLCQGAVTLVDTTEYWVTCLKIKVMIQCP